MLTYIPISLCAFFSRRVEWKAVEHKHAMTVSQVEKGRTVPKKRQ